MVKKSERRGNKRYRIKSGIAALMLTDRLKIVQLIDISASGLSFACQQFGLMKYRMYEVDILLLDDVRHPDKDIFFPNVKCTLVATDLYSNPAAYSLQQMTRCSVRFHAKLPLERYSLQRVCREESEACKKCLRAT